MEAASALLQLEAYILQTAGAFDLQHYGFAALQGADGGAECVH
jgi:hypothetical protein